MALQPKVFDVLRYLLEHRDRVVSKDELLEAIWGGEHVNESAVPWSISHLRSALGQRRGSKAPIETVHRRGYRFAASVEEVPGSIAPAANAGRASHAPARAAVSNGVPKPQARPFVGRIEVMERLEARLADAAQGRGQLCLMSGEAGIGKTRCCEELTARALARGFSAWSGRSIEDSGEPMFWPWIQILRQATRTRPELKEAGETLLARLSEATRPVVEPESRNASALDSRALRFWLLDEITSFLLNAARSAPLLLLFDDLHWSDEGTSSMLAFLAPELAKTRILVLATQRDEPTRGEPRKLVRLLRDCERIELARFTQSEVASYISAVTLLPEAPLALSHAVHRASAGNPLFVQEAVRTLIATHGESALASLEASAVAVPGVARDVLRPPLEALEPDTRRLLECASILGESFELPLLQTLSGEPMPHVLGSIEAACRAGLVVPETPHRYRFVHALIRGMLYDEIATGDRVALHRKAAEALESMQAAEPRYAEIAQHFYRSLPAGGYDRVVAATRRAAAAAEATLAHEAAVRFYAWALEAQALDSNVSARERAQLLLAYGRAQRYAGRERDSRETLYRMFELARVHGFADLLVRGAQTLRPTFAMSGVPEPRVREVLEDVLSMEQGVSDGPRILALSQLACVPPYADEMARSKELSARALELARAHGERGPLFQALRARLYSLTGPDDVDALLAVTNEILEIESARPPMMMRIEAFSARLGALSYRGERAAADQALEAISAAARELQLPEAIWFCDRQRAQRKFLSGDFAGAESACGELSSRGARLGLSYTPWFLSTLERLLAIERHGFPAVASARDFAMPPADTDGLRGNVRAVLLRAAAELNRRDCAERALDLLAVDDFAPVPKDVSYLNALSNIAMAVVLLDDLPHAEQLYGLLAPYAQYNTPDGMLFDEGSVSRYLGQLASKLGRHQQAEAHFEDALALNRRMGRRPILARTYLDYARWAGARANGSRARAQELAAEAVTIAESLGMHWLAEQAQAIAL